MRGKLMFLGGVAVGFVLGTRAGRERYEQLANTTRRVWDHPTVQEAAGVMQAQATRLYAGGRDVVSDKLGQSTLGQRLGQPQEDIDAAQTADDTYPGSPPPPSGTSF